MIKLHYTEFRRLQRGKCKNKSNVKSTNKGIDKWLHDAWEQLEIINVLTPRQQNLKILDFLEQSVHQFSEIFGNIKTLVYDGNYTYIICTYISSYVIRLCFVLNL